MNSLMLRRFFTLSLFFLLVFPQQAYSQAEQTDEQQHKSIIDYRIVQYISSSAPDPISIMRLDNNGELILACKETKTKKQISDMNFKVNESQIRLLKLYNLLTVENDNLKTAFPILDENQMGRIRKNTKQLALKLADYVQGDVEELITLLQKMNWTNNAYSILFAYIVDGTVWNDFYNLDLIHENTITKEHPFWAGQVWAFHPERQFSCGTNSSNAEDYKLVVNWSKIAYPVLGSFNKETRKLDEKVFLEFTRKGFTDDNQVKNTFLPFGVFNESGKLLLPVIEENKDNELYQISRRISKKIADDVPVILSLENLMKEYNFNNIEQTLIIAYHELMWDLMDEFVERGVVEKPILFSNPEKGTSENVADIVFIVHKRNN